MSFENEPRVDDVFEMLWDCKYCGQRKLLGLSHRCCAKCGSPQDPTARYFPPDHEKVAVRNHPFVGADVHCPACNAANAKDASCCTQCGSPLTAGAAVALRADDGGANLAARAAVSPSLLNAPNEPKKKSRVGLVLGLVGAGALVVVVGLVLLLTWRRGGTFEVQGHTWKRSIAVERFDMVRASSWCDELPSSARVLSRSSKERSKEKVPDGQDCKTRKKDQGNGTFREVKECQPKYKDKAVYADRCEYESPAWAKARSVDAKGDAMTPPPRWPDLTLARPGACLGCEREGAREEHYEVTFKDAKSGKTASCDLPEPRWRAFAPKARYDGQIGVVTGLLDCSALVKK